MIELSTYQNGEKIAKVFKLNEGYYTVEFFTNNRPVSKHTTQNEEDAENLAENFIMIDGYKPTLLNESFFG